MPSHGNLTKLVIGFTYLQQFEINEVGSTFVSKCIDAVETRGLTDQGLYRVVGVNSKVQRLLTNGLGE